MKKILIIIMLTLMPLNALCYEINVHKRIADKAIESSNIGQYLLNNLGIQLFKDKFKADIIYNYTAQEWIDAGSQWEDADLATRWLNHFYDPKTGNGLSISGTVLGQSSLVWGKDYYANLWSWKWTRDAYYDALTVTNPSPRNFYFAQLFRGLGQVIHLVHDLAVPSHVRNDPHNAPILGLPYDLYEYYTKGTEVLKMLPYTGYPVVDLTVFNSFDAFWKNDGKGLAEFTNRNFLSRHTNFDDPAYQNYNTPVATGEIVRAEIIEVPYLLPVQGEVRYMKGEVSDLYLQQLANIDRLTAFSYFDYEMKQIYNERVYSQNNQVFKEYAEFLVPRAVGYSAGLLNYFFRGDINLEPSKTDPSKFVIKNNSDEDMTGKFEIYYDNSNNERSLLLGFDVMTVNAHSKSMLITLDEVSDTKTYILVFKGKMGNETDAVVGRVVKYSPMTITAPDRCLYGLVDGAKLPQQFKQIKAKLTSSFTPDQAVQSGSLWAIAKYKRRLDYQPDLSTDPPSPGVIDPIFAYSTSASVPVTATDLVAMSATKEFAFNFSGSPIPAGITDLYLKVVFRGTDGTSQDVIAMGWKDLGEPMHHVYWNATDRFYLEGVLRTQSAIQNDPQLLERAQASGVPYGPFAIETDIAYCPTTDQVSNYQVEYASMAPGTFGRILTITESDQPEFTVVVHRKSITPLDESSSIFTSPTVINQDRNGVFMYFPVVSFRGIAMHAGAAYMKFTPTAPPNPSALPWPYVPAGTAPIAATVIAP